MSEGVKRLKKRSLVSKTKLLYITFHELKLHLRKL